MTEDHGSEEKQPDVGAQKSQWKARVLGHQVVGNHYKILVTSGIEQIGKSAVLST